MNLMDYEQCPRYEETAVLGHGAYGTVYKARDCRNEGTFVALKKIRIQTTSEEGIPMSTIREIAMLKLLPEHNNVVKLLDVVHGKRNRMEMSLWLVFEHVDMDLAKYLEKCASPGLGPDRIRDLFQQILQGVDFLHSNRIVHRDLKPQNVLVTNKGHVKIADFGLARAYAFQMALTNVVVTLWYRAPEVLLQDQYATAVDMWSCGCMFAELHTRRPLFCGQSERDQLIKIFDIIGLPTEDQWPLDIPLSWDAFQKTPSVPLERLIPEIEPAAKDLLQKLLLFKQGDRITASQSLKHKYFTSPAEEAAEKVSLSATLLSAEENNLSSTEETNLSDSHCSSAEESDLDESENQDNSENLENSIKENEILEYAFKNNKNLEEKEKTENSFGENDNDIFPKTDENQNSDNKGGESGEKKREFDNTPTGSETDSCMSTPHAETPCKVRIIETPNKERLIETPSRPLRNLKVATPNEALLQCNEDSLECDEDLDDNDDFKENLGLHNH